MLTRMILLDDPVWPAHGTLWGHVVSDTSLPELHAFARRAGLPSGGFDHDHYDYPLARRDVLIAAGAVPVTSGELLRRLRDAGLRVRPPLRTPRRPVALEQLRAAWSGLLPRETALRDALLTRWSSPGRHYHDVRHLASCLTALADLGCGDRQVHLAAWFHDAVYDGRPGEDEEASARLTERELAGLLPDADVAEVARLVRLTAGHAPDPGDARGALLVDADLSILGAIPGRYHVYVRDIRLEYAHLDEATFASGRTAVLRRLLALDPLYRTPAGVRMWAHRARTNLAEELTIWTR